MLGHIFEVKGPPPNPKQPVETVKITTLDAGSSHRDAQNSGFPGLRSSFSVEKGGGGGSTIPDVKKAKSSAFDWSRSTYAINVYYEVTKMNAAKQDQLKRTEHFSMAYVGSRG